jgi:putative flippase GtrA
MLEKYVFARFLIGGLINTAITYLFFLVLAAFLHQAVAYTISYIIGIVISYGLNGYFVFRSRFSLRSLSFFPLVYLVQYIAGLIVLDFATVRLAVSKEVAMLVVIAINIPLGFMLTRLVFTFKNN